MSEVASEMERMLVLPKPDPADEEYIEKMLAANFRMMLVYAMVPAYILVAIAALKSTYDLLYGFIEGILLPSEPRSKDEVIAEAEAEVESQSPNYERLLRIESRLLLYEQDEKMKARLKRVRRLIDQLRDEERGVHRDADLEMIDIELDEIELLEGTKKSEAAATQKEIEAPSTDELDARITAIEKILGTTPTPQQEYAPVFRARTSSGPKKRQARDAAGCNKIPPQCR